VSSWGDKSEERAEGDLASARWSSGDGDMHSSPETARLQKGLPVESTRNGTNATRTFTRTSDGSDLCWPPGRAVHMPIGACCWRAVAGQRRCASFGGRPRSAASAGWTGDGRVGLECHEVASGLGSCMGCVMAAKALVRRPSAFPEVWSAAVAPIGARVRRASASTDPSKGNSSLPVSRARPRAPTVSFLCSGRVGVYSDRFSDADIGPDVATEPVRGTGPGLEAGARFGRNRWFRTRVLLCARSRTRRAQGRRPPLRQGFGRLRG
jgi:hypothetical protein